MAIYKEENKTKTELFNLIFRNYIFYTNHKNKVFIYRVGHNISIGKSCIEDMEQGIKIVKKIIKKATKEQIDSLENSLIEPLTKKRIKWHLSFKNINHHGVEIPIYKCCSKIDDAVPAFGSSIKHIKDNVNKNIPDGSHILIFLDAYGNICHSYLKPKKEFSKLNKRQIKSLIKKLRKDLKRDIGIDMKKHNYYELRCALYV